MSGEAIIALSEGIAHIGIIIILLLMIIWRP